MNYVGRASGATLGFIAGNVPGAVLGYELARRSEKSSPNMTQSPSSYAKKYMKKHKLGFTNQGRLFNLANYMPTPPRGRKPNYATRNAAAKKIQHAWRGKKRIASAKRIAGVRRKHRQALVGVSTPTSAGQFKRPSKVVKTFESKANALGYHCTLENYGTVVDSDCVYVYHSNWNAERISRVLTGALLRTLFRKAGIEIGNQEQELPLYAIDDSDGFKIVYTVRNPISSTHVDIVYNIANGQTFETVVNGFAAGAGTMGQQFKEIMWNGNFDEPYSLALYASDRNGVATNWRLHTFMTLQDEFVVLESSSAIMVQNRTAGSSAGAGDLSLDRVDNQPLKGYLYEFKNGDPRLRTNQLKGVGFTTDNEDQVYSSGDLIGIRAFGGSACTGTFFLMNEPPVPTIWRNVEKSSKISLEPGTMKKSKIVTQYKHRLPELLKKMRVNVTGSSLALGMYHGLRGMKSQIIALEETLRTPTSNLITCLYENELKVGAYTYTKKLKGVFRSELTNNSINQWVKP